MTTATERERDLATPVPGRAPWVYDRRRLFPTHPRSRRVLAGATLTLTLGMLLGGTYALSRPVAPVSLAPVVVHAPPMLEGVRVSPAPVRGITRRARAGEMVAIELTAYCLRGTTRRGRYVRPGIVAADPRIFPLSRFVEVFIGDRYEGRFLVDDTGLRIKGPILDVWKPTCREARLFGRRKGMAVLVGRS